MGIDTTRAVAAARAHYEALAAATGDPTVKARGCALVACLTCGTVGMRSGAGMDARWRDVVAYWEQA